MQHFYNGYRGMAFLMRLNWDRVLYIATIGVALATGAMIGPAFFGLPG
ncbi:MAG: hypothetical protein AAGK67_09165 [Pseudomonadota bacterium]